MDYDTKSAFIKFWGKDTYLALKPFFSIGNKYDVYIKCGKEFMCLHEMIAKATAPSIYESHSNSWY